MSGSHLSAFLTSEVIAPVLVAALGLWMLLAPRRHREAGEARHAARLAELAASAAETFFEERRSLEAYRPPHTDRGWRIIGTALMLVGISRAVLALLNAG